MSEDTLLPFDLPSVAHKKVSVGFDGGQLSSDAGVLVLRGVEKKLGLAARHRRCAMAVNERRILRCAIYTRKSSEHGLEQDFNSLDAQREAAEVFIKSQAHEGWRLVKARYDDGGISGGTLERPALQSLLDDIRSRKVDVVVVYKVDRPDPVRSPISPSWSSCSRPMACHSWPSPSSSIPRRLWAG